MGNPHCTFFVEDVQAIDVATLGPRIEAHPPGHRQLGRPG
ncbi:Diaminopimelate epimerase [Pseudomonas chlororaphis subsp. chlororaphis]|nr:Diaminopimelate epimerase [Pseudomonas chlororaphis subsp. chlororaphis]